MSRLAIVSALEALEAGDQDLAVAILLGALEDQPKRSSGNGPPFARTYTCPDCQADYEFPGLLEKHRILFHSIPEAA